MHTENDKTNTKARNDITESTTTNRIAVIMNQNYSQVQKSEHPNKHCFYCPDIKHIQSVHIPTSPGSLHLADTILQVTPLASYPPSV